MASSRREDRAELIEKLSEELLKDSPRSHIVKDLSQKLGLSITSEDNFVLLGQLLTMADSSQYPSRSLSSKEQEL